MTADDNSYTTTDISYTTTDIEVFLSRDVEFGRSPRVESLWALRLLANSTGETVAVLEEGPGGQRRLSINGSHGELTPLVVTAYKDRRTTVNLCDSETFRMLAAHIRSEHELDTSTVALSEAARAFANALAEYREEMASAQLRAASWVTDRTLDQGERDAAVARLVDATAGVARLDAVQRALSFS
jgi:hypothetical protein